MNKGGEIAAITHRRLRQEADRHVGPLVVELRGQGLSLQAIADELNRRGLTTRQKLAWNKKQVSRVLDRVTQPQKGSAAPEPSEATPAGCYQLLSATPETPAPKCGPMVTLSEPEQPALEPSDVSATMESCGSIVQFSESQEPNATPPAERGIARLLRPRVLPRKDVPRV